ncbi:MAG: GspE/PulE family protein, partial [Candidatus Lariskella arthropodorum]
IAIGEVVITSDLKVRALLDKVDMNFVKQLSTIQLTLRNCIDSAITQGVSDIHIAVRPDECKVKFRHSGMLKLHAVWSSDLARKVCFVAFNKETDNSGAHFNGHTPQDGSMTLKLASGELVRIRLASVPAHPFPSFDVVFRILNVEGSQLKQDLITYGYTPTQVALLKLAIAKPNGAVIVSGPTGSGKTTTLATLLGMIPEHKKVYSIEDPVEKIVQNATQIPVNTDSNKNNFAGMTRQTLRLDPDCISIGEIRDSDTAIMAARAAITGHMVLSTLHTNSAMNIVYRLKDLGLTTAQLVDPSFLVLLVFQMLIKVLCPHCSRSIESDEMQDDPRLSRWQSYFGSEKVQNFKIKSGVLSTGDVCPHCNGSGYAGRQVIAETLWLDDVGRQMIEKGEFYAWAEHLKKNGFMTYIDHAKMLTLKGIVDVRDVELLLGEFHEFSERASLNYNEVCI